MSTIYTTEWMNALSIHHPFCYGLTDILDFANLCDHVLLNTQDILHIKLANTAIEEVYRTHKPLGVRGELDTTTNIMSVLHRIQFYFITKQYFTNWQHNMAESRQPVPLCQYGQHRTRILWTVHEPTCYLLSHVWYNIPYSQACSCTSTHRGHTGSHDHSNKIDYKLAMISSISTHVLLNTTPCL